jgi:hypothetical protein
LRTRCGNMELGLAAIGPEATVEGGLIGRGVSDEWHVDLRKPQDEKDLGNRASEVKMGFGSPLVTGKEASRM